MRFGTLLYPMRSSLEIYLKYLRRIRNYIFPMSVGVGADFFATFLAMIPPLFLILIFDYAYPQRNLNLLTGTIIAGLIIYFVNFFLSSMNDYINAYIDQKVGTSLAADLFQKIMVLHHPAQMAHNIGDLSVRALEDSDISSGLIVNSLQVVVINLISLLLFLIISLAINPYVTILSLASIPVYLLETHFYSGRLENLRREVQVNRAETLNTLQERLMNLRTIKAFGQEENESRQFGTFMGRRLHLHVKQKVISIITVFSNSITLRLWAVFVTWYMGFEVIRGRLSIGEVVALGTYITQLAGPIKSLSDFYTDFRTGMVSLRRVDDILSLPAEDKTPDDREYPDIDLKGGNIQLKEVFFQYNPLSLVLKGISFDIKPRSSIAIVGESGAGKSTLINLLLRFYDPSRGMIFIDGYDVSKILLKALRRQIGVVFQEISLFAGSIRKNITYGHPNCSEADMIEAARMAVAHDFIMSLPQGYDTPVERFGQNLSGGQRQRIAIARALVTKPKILILDEAASALDAESEFLLQETVRRCSKQMTVILVAHHLSQLKGVDRIVVLDEGQIAETGTFNELITQKGIFFNLYQLQTGGFQEFQQRLQIEFARHMRYRQDLSLLVLSVREYNDYAKCEEVAWLTRWMQAICLNLRKNMRVMDFSATFKDSKIVIGLPHTSLDAAERMGKRMREYLAAEEVSVDRKKLRATVVVQATSCKNRTIEFAEQLIEEAERNLPIG